MSAVHEIHLDLVPHRGDIALLLRIVATLHRRQVTVQSLEYSSSGAPPHVGMLIELGAAPLSSVLATLNGIIGVTCAQVGEISAATRPPA